MRDHVLVALRAARRLLTPKKRWTQAASARNTRGRSVEPVSKAAACWCLMGAIERVTAGPGSQNNTEGMCLMAIRDATPNLRSIVQYNDQSTHAQVLALLDRAIARRAAL